MKTQITVERLNMIQKEWMGLDPFAPEPEKRRVFKLMDEMPKDHLTVGTAKADAQLMLGGCPCWANALPLNEAKEYARKYNVRIDIAWMGAGDDSRWVNL